MGIAPYVAEAIIREHKHRPITGDVLLLGRQTMLFSPAEAATMVADNGIIPASGVLDGDVLDRRTLASSGQSFIRDDAFFRLLGVPRVTALDHADYEGAEVIHDLNTPIPKSLEASADFILDGSTLDNLFDPATALKNIARMLRPMGRYIGINMGSMHRGPYSIASPYWFLDYFAANSFRDCRVYLLLHSARGRQVLIPPADAMHSMTLPSDYEAGTFVFAEKSDASTWEEIPDQRPYASDTVRAVYLSGANCWAASGRPHLLKSAGMRFAPSFISLSLRDRIRGFWRAAYSASAYFKLVDQSGAERPIPLPPWMRLTKSILGHIRS